MSLFCIGTVLWDPISWVGRDPLRVTCTGKARGDCVRREVRDHQLVHVLAHEHVRVYEHDAIVLDQVKDAELGPHVPKVLERDRLGIRRNGPERDIPDDTAHGPDHFPSWLVDLVCGHHH